MPHTGRPSTARETSTSAFSCEGCSSQLRAAARQAATERENSGREAIAPCGSGGKPQAARPSTTRAASARSASAGASSSSIPDQRAVDVGGRHGLAPRDAAEREPRERHRRHAALGLGQVEQPPHDRVDDDGLDGRHLGRRHARGVQLDHGRPQPRRRGGDLVDRRRPGERRAQLEGAAGHDRHQVRVLDHAEHAAGGGDHRAVADAAVEHVQQRLAAGHVRGHGVGRRAHRGRDRVGGVAPGGHDAGAQVAVGEDAEPAVAEVDHHGGGLRLGHALRRLADRRRGRADDERRAHQLAHRARAVCAGGSPPSGAITCSSERATKRTPAGRASSGAATAARMR